MTAQAIRAAAANFRSCLEGLRPLAERRGVSRAVFDANVAGLTPDLRIMDLLDAQPEFTKSFWDYLDILVNDDRIKNGRDILAKYRPTFDAVEKAYGVDRYIIAAIWGVESNYGTMVGDRSVIRSTATLACIGRRQDYFREEFLSALEILARGDVRADHLKGSWAGAFGPTQFMPTSFKRFAVDYDGDGRRDVVEFRARPHRLDREQPEEGRLGGGPDLGLRGRAAEGLQLSARRPLAHDDDGGMGAGRHPPRRRQAVPASRRSRLPAGAGGAQGPGFLMLQNFRVIMKYNPAEAYALAIGHLADRFRGAGPFVQAWPRHERVLTRAERYELQQQLAQRGFDVGEPDGRLGGKTRNALRQFQSAVGEVPDGFASEAILQRLRSR